MDNQYVYAFQYCQCIYESSYATMSLHRTEKGAQIALEFHKNQKLKEFNDWQEQAEDLGLKFGVGESWQVYQFLVEE